MRGPRVGLELRGRVIPRRAGRDVGCESLSTPGAEIKVFIPPHGVSRIARIRRDFSADIGHHAVGAQLWPSDCSGSYALALRRRLGAATGDEG